MGVGKTQLARLLAEALSGKAVLERVEENPFLKKFYAEPRKYAFQTQIFFLLSRFRQHAELLQQDLFARITIMDYMFEKDRIFAYITLDEEELELYEQVYSVLSPQLVRPDFVIYLHASTDVLMRRIKRWGRDFERGVDMEYLERVSAAYRQFFFRYSQSPLLVVDTTRVDFAERPEELEQLIKEIKRAKGGTQYFIPWGS